MVDTGFSDTNRFFQIGITETQKSALLDQCIRQAKYFVVSRHGIFLICMKGAVIRTLAVDNGGSVKFIFAVKRSDTKVRGTDLFCSDFKRISHFVWR